MNKLPNISDYRDISIIPYVLLGTFLVELVVIFLVRYIQLGGKSLNIWYDKFSLHAVIANVFIILIVIILAQIVYTHFVKPYYGWNPIIFILIVVLIQIIHHLALYIFVILPIPKGHNSIMDLYKIYAKEIGRPIIIIDAIIIISSVLVTIALQYLPVYVNTFIAILAIYILPYILHTRHAY